MEYHGKRLTGNSTDDPIFYLVHLLVLAGMPRDRIDVCRSMAPEAHLE